MALVVPLPRDASAPVIAREAARDYLQDRTDRANLADVLLITTELVTNALIHGEGDMELRLDHDGDQLRGQVIDGGTGFESEVRERGLHAVGGRGLKLVAALSDRWGVFEGSSHVWFELDLRAFDDRVTDPELGTPPPEVP